MGNCSVTRVSAASSAAPDRAWRMRSAGPGSLMLTSGSYAVIRRSKCSSPAVVVPEHIGGDQVHPAGLQQLQRKRPLRTVKSAEVDLPTDRDPASAVPPQRPVGGHQIGRWVGPRRHGHPLLVGPAGVAKVVRLAHNRHAMRPTRATRMHKPTDHLYESTGSRSAGHVTEARQHDARYGQTVAR